MKLVVTQTNTLGRVRVERSRNEDFARFARLPGLPLDASWDSTHGVFVLNAALPTSPAGLNAGDFWISNGVVAVVGTPSWLPTSTAGLSGPAFWNDNGTLALVGNYPGIPATSNPSAFPSLALYCNGGAMCAKQ